LGTVENLIGLRSAESALIDRWRGRAQHVVQAEQAKAAKQSIQPDPRST